METPELQALLGSQYTEDQQYAAIGADNADEPLVPEGDNWKFLGRFKNRGVEGGRLFRVYGRPVAEGPKLSSKSPKSPKAPKVEPAVEPEPA